MTNKKKRKKKKKINKNRNKEKKATSTLLPVIKQVTGDQRDSQLEEECVL